MVAQWRRSGSVGASRPVRNLTRHPGDTFFQGNPARDRKHVLLPADDVIHLFMPGAVKSWSAVVPQRDGRCASAAGLREAAVIRARASAASWDSSPITRVS